MRSDSKIRQMEFNAKAQGREGAKEISAASKRFFASQRLCAFALETCARSRPADPLFSRPLKLSNRQSKHGNFRSSHEPHPSGVANSAIDVHLELIVDFVSA